MLDNLVCSTARFLLNNSHHDCRTSSVLTVSLEDFAMKPRDLAIQVLAKTDCVVGLTLRLAIQFKSRRAIIVPAMRAGGVKIAVKISTNVMRILVLLLLLFDINAHNDTEIQFQ